MTNDLDIVQPAREPDAVWRPTGAIDPVRLEVLWKLAERIASSALVPMSLRGEGKEGTSSWKPFDDQKVVANVFAVVEQADRWGSSPFALLSSAQIVYGKLGFEGKVIADVLESRYRIKLGFEFSGPERTDQRAITVIGYDPATNEVLKHPITGKPLEIKGTVADWKTTHAGSPWTPPRYDIQLIYRGSRDWARAYRSGAIMGTNSIDELLAYENESRALAAEDKTASLANRFKPGVEDRSGGFSPSNVKQIEDARASAQLAGEVDTAPAREKAEAKSREPKQEPDKSVEGAPGQESEQDQPPRIGREIHEQYSGALIRVSKPDALKKMAAEFWNGHGGWPLKNINDIELAKKTFDTHSNRVDGKISIEDAKAFIAELIAESYGEGL